MSAGLSIEMAEDSVSEHGPDVPGSIAPAIKVLFDRLAYCRARLDGLEGK